MSPLPDVPDADAIAAAVLTCPSVAGLSDEVATYLPGRRVVGVRVEPESVEVHVISRYGTPLTAVATEVRRAAAAVTSRLTKLDIVVADVQDPFDPDPVPSPLPPAGAVPVVTTDASALALPVAPAP